jgi:hypothetical protein
MPAQLLIDLRLGKVAPPERKPKRSANPWSDA